MRKAELETYFEELESEFLDVSIMDKMPNFVRRDMAKSGMFKERNVKDLKPQDEHFDPIVFANNFKEPEEELKVALENSNVREIWKHIRLRKLSVEEKLKIVEFGNNGLILGLMQHQLLNSKVQNAIARLNNKDFFEELLRAESLSEEAQLLIVKSKEYYLIKKLLNRGSSVLPSVQKAVILSCNQRLISLLISKKCLSIANQRLLYHNANRENLLKYQENNGFSYEALRTMKNS